jgi:hypothetical protein
MSVAQVIEAASPLPNGSGDISWLRKAPSGQPPLFGKWRPEVSNGSKGFFRKLGALHVWGAILLLCAFFLVAPLIVLLLAAAFIYWAYCQLKDSMSCELAGVFDSPGAMVQYAVKAEFAAGRIPYGSDYGVVSFADGWLHFQGRCTEFHLSRDDTEGKIVRKSRGRTALAVQMSGPSFLGEVFFLPVAPGGSDWTRLSPFLREAFFDWRRSRALGVSLFPPRRTKPEAVLAQKRALLGAIGYFAISMLVGAAIGIWKNTFADYTGNPFLLVYPSFCAILGIIALRGSSLLRALELGMRIDLEPFWVRRLPLIWTARREDFLRS